MAVVSDIDGYQVEFANRAGLMEIGALASIKGYSWGFLGCDINNENISGVVIFYCDGKDFFMSYEKEKEPGREVIYCYDGAFNSEPKQEMDLIQPVPVTRDKYGFWVHPDFPTWDEETTDKQIEQWQDDHGVIMVSLAFGEVAPEDLLERYKDKGDVTAVKDWDPVELVDVEGAFLFSVHEDEYAGPVAIVLVPSDDLK